MQSGFTRLKELNDERSPNLYVANCGPKVGISYGNVKSMFETFGEVIGIHAADETGARVIVRFAEVRSAQAAFKALNGYPCQELGGRTLHIRYSVPHPTAKVKGNVSLSISLVSSELEIPGVHLVRDFITAKQEQELLEAVDVRPWKHLSKRRVQHYGYEFIYEGTCSSFTLAITLTSRIPHHLILKYLSRAFMFSSPPADPLELETFNGHAMGRNLLFQIEASLDGARCCDRTIDTRNVDSKLFLGELPSFVSPVLDKILSFPDLDGSKSKLMDQLTVNEYPSGVGLSPHIDTHSAFDDLIFSLSLAGPCIMEFRRYQHGTWPPVTADDTDVEGGRPNKCSNFIRKAIFLPPRSMLLLSGEGRYAWHHYIPHHKVDLVGEQVVRRCTRRVSFTFRKVRTGPCCCEYRQYCDSQREAKLC